jgi:hypothetical protein
VVATDYYVQTENDYIFSLFFLSNCYP